MKKCFNIMKIMQLHLYLLIWCRAAETLTDRFTDSGQNVTLNCDLDVTEVNWLLLKPPDPPVMILRTSTTSATFYYNKTFKQKYSVQSKHDLFINNITVDDLGLYYCLTTDTPPKYSDGSRIYFTEPEIMNHTVMKYIEQTQTHWTIIIISAFINALLIIVIIGLVKVFVLGSKRSRENWKQSQVMDVEESQNSRQEQFSTAVLSSPCKRFQPRQINDTYALLELPESTTHNNI